MTKEEMVTKAKEQLANFQKEIDEIKEASSHLSEEAKKQFDVGAKELEHLYKEADEKFDELSHKAEENYKDAKAFIELTNKALKHSFNYFMSHYRKK
jgi:DNA-binding transcriptional MerR regulator